MVENISLMQTVLFSYSEMLRAQSMQLQSLLRRQNIYICCNYYFFKLIYLIACNYHCSHGI